MRVYQRMPRFVKALLPIFLVVLSLSGWFMTHPGGRNAYAGAEVVGNQHGAVQRALIGSQDGSVKRIVYFAQTTYTMANTTPVASDPYCGNNYTLHKAQVVLTGTMAGTNPTLAVKWQNSIDGGTTWTDVGTWTTINATVTPSSQSQTVADVYNNTTAVAYGDCWRATYTFGGTGTVTANIGIVGFEK
jgi:hypothetical protein